MTNILLNMLQIMNKIYTKLQKQKKKLGGSHYTKGSVTFFSPRNAYLNTLEQISMATHNIKMVKKKKCGWVTEHLPNTDKSHGFKPSIEEKRFRFSVTEFW